jgi:hypothetical protein
MAQFSTSTCDRGCLDGNRPTPVREPFLSCGVVDYIGDELQDAYTGGGRLNGRRVSISVECDAWQQVATLAKPLSSVAAGDLFRAGSGYGAGAGFLESLLEGEETVFQVSSVDA